MLLVLSFSFALTGCSSSDTETVEDTDTVTVNDVVVENDDSDTDVEEEIADRKEYQFEVSMKVENEMNMKMKIYKKGDNSLMEMVKMEILGNEEQMPFDMKKIITTTDKTYQQVEKNGETYRFELPNMGNNEMFNLKEMSQVDMSIVKETKNEKINGVKMKCYYIDDMEEGKGKACLLNNVFMYGEFNNEESGNSVIEITNYKKKVNNSVFDLPKEDEIRSSQDMMMLFQ